MEYEQKRANLRPVESKSEVMLMSNACQSQFIAMSIVQKSDYGWLISHPLYLDQMYSDIGDPDVEMKNYHKVFNINTPYKSTAKSKKQRDVDEEVDHVEQLFRLFCKYLTFETLSDCPNNKKALNIADFIYKQSEKFPIRDMHGSNYGPNSIQEINSQNFVFPKNCKFFCKDVNDLSNHLEEDVFDLILLDPPWWNKYIRRKRKLSNNAYDMMYNRELEDIPVGNHLKDDALVVVWCTNCVQHLETLIHKIFPKWGVSYLGKWYWVKITKSGQPICEFSTPPRKQPFEQIIIGRKSKSNIEFPVDKLVLSVPSAIHSHKPPLCRILEPFLPENPQCLEIFARYLLPNWTSYGNEVLKFQLECFYS